jgi:MFS family permease
VSLVISIISATMILVSPFYGWIAARLSTRLLLGLTLAIFAVGHLMVGGIDTLTPTLVASVFFGIGATLIQPVCTSYLLTTLPPSTHGRAMGGLIGCLFLGQFINPFIMQPLIATMHLAPSLVFLGVLNIVFALLFAAAPLFLRRSAVKG